MLTVVVSIRYAYKTKCKHVPKTISVANWHYSVGAYLVITYHKLNNV